MRTGGVFHRLSPVACRLSPVACLSLMLAQSAFASKPRLRLERAVTVGCPKEPFIQVHFSELELEGSLRRRPASEYRLVLDDQPLPARPEQIGSFAKSGERLRLALVVQTTASYGSSMDRLRGALRELVRSLPRETRFSIVAYDSQAHRLLPLGDPRQAVLTLDSMEAMGASVDLALDEALTLGLRSLGSTDPALRRILVLVSDGVNRSPKRDVFRGLGSRARSLQVPIHPIGFSPMDERGPLINLGELAKRSLGTMRWAQRAEDLSAQVANLGRELLDQVVLRFPWPGGCRRVAKLQVSSGDLLSNPVELAAVGGATQSAPERSRSVSLGLFLGGLVAAAVLLAVAARALIRPKRKKEPPPPDKRRRLPGSPTRRR
jgi:hypothetical protein